MSEGAPYRFDILGGSGSYDRTARAKAEGPRKGEPSSSPMRQARAAGLARLVRGSSRRIHDYVGRDQSLIHEYQSDQPSAKTSSAFAHAAMSRTKIEDRY